VHHGKEYLQRPNGILTFELYLGNGTQKAFYDDPDVLYISLHRHDNGDFYPSGNYGDMNHCGMDKGIGRCVEPSINIEDAERFE
jgi:acetoin utilization deacetylase AcuC-like enzyme